MGLFQTAVRAVYPDRCLVCEGLVDGEGGLCGACWAAMPFVTGLACHMCGLPLPGAGEAEGGGGSEICDDCLTLARPWAAGRTVAVYEGAARTLVLRLKHADRLDLAGPAAGWMLRAAAPLLTPRTLVVPVPSHWVRRIRRRYVQSAVLSRALAARAGLDHAPLSLVRTKATAMQDGMGVAARFANLAGAIRPDPRHGGALAGREVLLVDDVMTSGATLAAAADAAHAAGAQRVCVLTLARVAKAP